MVVGLVYVLVLFVVYIVIFFFFSSRRRHTRSVSAFLLNRSSDLSNLEHSSKKKGIKDECSRLLEASTMKSRRGFAIQRLMNAMRQAHADGWFIVFDTLRSEERRVGKECIYRWLACH